MDAILKAEGSAIDHEKKNKIDRAYQINVFKYGDQMVNILSARQKIAGRLLDRGVSDEEHKLLYQMLEFHNEKIKLEFGL